MPLDKMIITDEFEGEVVIGTDEDDEELPKPTSEMIVVPGEEYLHDDELKDMPEEVRIKIENQVKNELMNTRFGTVGKTHVLGRGKRTESILLDEERFINDKEAHVKPIGKESRKSKR